MLSTASVWVTACVCLLPLLAFQTKNSGNLFEKKLTDLLDEAHRITLPGRNLHEAKLSSLLRDATLRQGKRHEHAAKAAYLKQNLHLTRQSAAHAGTPVLGQTPITQRRTKFPEWHYMHEYSNETFEGETVNYDTWRRPMASSKEIVDAFRKYYPREQRPRYTKYNFTEIGSIFEQAFIDGELNSADYDYLRVALKRNMTGVVHTRGPFAYLTTRVRRLKPWKKNYTQYEIDPDYYNEIMGINTTWPAWLSTPINEMDDLMIQAWILRNQM